MLHAQPQEALPRPERAPAMGPDKGLDSIESAVADIAVGKPVVVVDDEDRENEGDLIFAAELATPELLAFMIRHTSGLVCVALSGEDCDRLDLPPMREVNQDKRETAYRVTVDAAHGVNTGISATDRARTIRLLSQAGTGPGDLTRPGHVLPLRARDGGVLSRTGHTEAAADLARLAGLRPAGALCELVSQQDVTGMARLGECRTFAAEHHLAIISIADLVAYRRRVESTVVRAADTSIPTEHGEFRALGYHSLSDGLEHIALVRGEIGEGEGVLVRVHSECLTGDVFGSRRCDCGPQLASALGVVADAGRGVVLYLRGHEGRGIGLLHKLQAYQLQDAGLDTVDANLALGLPSDARDYATAAQILAELGVRSIHLLGNNPAKQTGLESYGVDVVSRLPLPTLATAENVRYLATKRDRMGHDLPGLAVLERDLAAPRPADAPTRHPRREMLSVEDRHVADCGAVYAFPASVLAEADVAALPAGSHS